MAKKLPEIQVAVLFDIDVHIIPDATAFEFFGMGFAHFIEQRYRVEFDFYTDALCFFIDERSRIEQIRFAFYRAEWCSIQREKEL